jgi:streptomycin 6-kinase
MTADIEGWLQKWQLEPDGETFISGTGQFLIPVRDNGQPAMLKIMTQPEERNGAHLLVWWNGIGAVRVLRHEGDALLMERAPDPMKLVDMSRAGHDDDAIRILVDVASRLHQPRQGKPPATLISMEIRFRSLWRNASEQGGFYREAANTARTLLDHPTDQRVLHGDIQHYNVLDFGERGWLVIDPKGLLGESTYDFANIFCNPHDEVALSPGRVAHRANLIAELTGVGRSRLLQWVVAYCGLSASWHLEDGTDPFRPLHVGAAALKELARG